MDAPTLLRGVVATYLAALGVLGAGTVLWATNGLLVERSMPVASFWFLLAGFGTVLTAVLLWGYLDGDPVLRHPPGPPPS